MIYPLDLLSEVGDSRSPRTRKMTLVLSDEDHARLEVQVERLVRKGKRAKVATLAAELIVLGVKMLEDAAAGKRG